jgi:hypothetical protein
MATAAAPAAETVLRDVALPSARFPWLPRAASVLHFLTLLPLVVLFNWINFGQSDDVGIVRLDAASPQLSLTLGIDLGDFADWYSECLGASRGPQLASWTGVAILATLLVQYLGPLCAQGCCRRAPWSARTTALVYAGSILLQLLAIICFRVGYALAVQDLNAACCQRTDFSSVGALRRSMKDPAEAVIWDMYCSMTQCACDFDSQPGTKLVTGAFFAAAVAAWAVGVALVALDQYLAWPRAAGKA